MVEINQVTQESVKYSTRFIALPASQQERALTALDHILTTTRSRVRHWREVGWGVLITPSQNPIRGLVVSPELQNNTLALFQFQERQALKSDGIDPKAVAVLLGNSLKHSLYMLQIDTAVLEDVFKDRERRNNFTGAILAGKSRHTAGPNSGVVFRPN